MLRRLQSDPATAKIPVVVVERGPLFRSGTRAIRELGAVDYLIKPFDVRDLLQAVDSALGSPDRQTLLSRTPVSADDQIARSRPSQYGSRSLRL